MARLFMKGCEAIAEAAVRAGCRFFAGYPITPQNDIPEYFADVQAAHYLSQQSGEQILSGVEGCSTPGFDERKAECGKRINL